MFSKPAVLGALARFVLSAYVAMVCRRFFSVSVGALFFVELKFGREISHDLIEHTVFPRISARVLTVFQISAQRMGA